jgi:hypothetical protein
LQARRWRDTLRLAITVVCGGLALAAPAPAGELPPNTVLLSEVMRKLSGRPGFTDEFVAKLAGGGKKAALPLTPELRHELRELILGKNWQGLDRFPGWSMERLNPLVGTVQRIAAPSGPQPSPDQTLAKYLDLGLYPLSRSGSVSLDVPPLEPPFDATGLNRPLTDGVSTGDGPDPEVAPLHAESTRLADLMNRLSANTLNGASPLSVEIAGHSAVTPEQLIAALLATGHHVEVVDARYFANFGSLHWQETPDANRDVMAPFWINTRIMIPGTSRELLVPASHAEYQWTITGPTINAALSFWFGIDGKAEFRTTDTLAQGWVMGHHAHVYTGADAIEVTRLAGKIVATYARLHLAHPDLAFGGYYTLGVCQDVVAAIELKMTGTSTLFPNTADNNYFPEHPQDARDAEIFALIRRLPKDGQAKKPDAARIFGSLPLGDTDQELAHVSIPGLAPDLIAVHDAWQDGSLEHPERRWLGWFLAALLVLGIVILVLLHANRSRFAPR